MLVAFRLEGDNIANYAGDFFDFIDFGPNDDTWIQLSKNIVQFKGQYAQEEWRKDLTYHSTLSVPGQYHVDIVLHSFIVHHAEQANRYNGWMALGGSGGFIYFMVVIHIMVMMGGGILLNNESKFLAGNEHHEGPKYEVIGGDRNAPEGSAENRRY